MGLDWNYSMRVWRQLDVTAWPIVHEESRGKRVKRWVEAPAPDGSHWLRKEPRDSRPFEPAIEALMLHLAEGAGVPSAEGSVCEWREGSEAKRGLVVRLFLDRRREQLTLGAQLLKQHHEQYDPEAKWNHTLPFVRSALLGIGGNESILTTSFARMLAFDAWIGNGDRHQENWGIIEPTGAGPVRLAPMFDPAACLGAELQENDSHLQEARCGAEKLARYASKCPSGFGDGDHPVSLERVVEEVSDWPEWRANVHLWLAQFARAMDTFRELLAGVPDPWLPVPRKIFARRLLEHRLEWLQRRAGV